MSGDAKEEKVAKIIKLKENSLKDEVFAYVRANLIKKEERWSKKTGKPFEKKSHLLISQPVDPEFEMLVVGCVIQLLEGLEKAKYSQSIEADKKKLAKDKSGEAPISFRIKSAIMYRLYQKTILNNNKNLMQILIRLLARVRGLEALDMKKNYMTRVEDYETEEEVMLNRIKLRKYLRELTLNQKRIIKAATEAALKEKQAKLEKEIDIINT